ncbi:oxidoreductase C-terminal domain-containing protein [Tardiphaga sp.]|uniref:oxidoreductase C-terminal domain-containing protein n=1 Tax=Tardiphaga sp. TaxID=1926292 RepID=UPI003529FEC8
MFSYRNNDLVAIESVNRSSDHMIGRKIFAAGSSLTPEQAADPAVDLKSCAA